ncbi:MAG TPA: cyanophycin synthetase [Pyrinomonadaceae bacterium]|nr:cyanophycin synthetase [Pyrinomonadaceae bacterium]
MKILETRTLRGPNYWSGYWKRLIIMRLDIEDYEEKPTDKIENFYERITEIVPSLVSHGCSYQEEGGFLKRIEEGTWAGHVIEHLALEMQTLAGMEVGFGRTRETSERGIYNVVFSYLEEAVGRFAARAAVRLFLSLAEGKPLEEIKKSLAADIQEMREIREKVRFGPSTGSIVEEAEKRSIPYIRLNEQSLVQLGYGINQRRIQATTTDKTNMISVDIAGNKASTKTLLGEMGVPVPKGFRIYDADEIDGAVDKIGFPIVVKPLDANHGKGASINLNSPEEVREAFYKAKEYSGSIIIEKMLIGADFRALVVDNRLVAVAERTPAHIVGDGKNTIQNLINKENENPLRGYGHEKVLTLITVDSQTKTLLEAKNYTLETVLPEGEIFYLKSTANLSTGGTAIDRTDETHPANVFLFERIAKIVGLDVAGIDVIAPNVSEPLAENGGGIIEINAAPGFRMHLSPSEGIGRNVAEHVVDMLFPPGTSSRIPIIAITGTNGKTTTTRLIANIIRGSGRVVGFTTTDGTYIQNNQILTGDNTGPVSAQLVLKDPSVQVAVLETARGGIIRSGIGYDHCDVAVVTNVAADHLGLKDVNTLEDLARVKSVVPRSVSRRGFAVLNAEDDLVYNMGKLVDGECVYFALDENNKRIQKHARKGGLSCIYENGFITLLKGKWKVRVEKAVNIPSTYGGRAEFMIQNALAATLACFVHGVSLEDIRVGLTTFNAGTAQTPGRLNFIEVGRATVLIDYAHNPAGLTALRNFIGQMPFEHQTVVMNGTGDRRDDDLREMGRLCGAYFERIVIRRGHHLRGRDEAEMYRLLKEGIKDGGRASAVEIVPESREAILYAVENSKPGELIVLLGDDVANDIQIVNQIRDDMNALAAKP